MVQFVQITVMLVLAFLVCTSFHIVPTWVLNVITSKYFFVIAMVVAYKINIKTTIVVAFTLMMLYIFNSPSIEKYEAFDQTMPPHPPHQYDEEIDSITASIEQSIVDKLWFPETNE